MAGLVIGDPATDIGGPFGLTVADGFEQVLESEDAVGDARLAPGIAHPALDIGAGMTAGGESGRAQIGAFQVATEMGAENPDQPGNIGEGNLDVTIEAPGTYQSRIEPRRIVAGGDDDHALASHK